MRHSPPLSLLFALLTGCGSYGLTDYSTDGLVGSQLSLYPELEIQFPTTPAGGINWSELTLLSTGDVPIRVEEIWIAGESADDFHLPDEMPIPADLEPGVEMPITLRYMPAYVGQSRATVTVGLDYMGALEMSRDLIGRACSDDDGDDVCDE